MIAKPRGSRHVRPSRFRPRLTALEGRTLLSGTPSIYTVTDLSDSATDTGSLRHAVTQANADPNPAGSRIEFDPTVFSVPRTITLAGTLELSEAAGPEVIDGPGASVLTVARSGAAGTPDFRIFTVPFSLGGAVSISGLTISGGDATGDVGGGGIDNHGTLSVTNCTISGNHADNGGGGIDNYYVLKVAGSTISGNSAVDRGGGIANEEGINIVLLSVLTVTDTTISGNSTGFGGGIDNQAGLTVTDSTLSGNHADDGGGGIDNQAGLTVTDSTLSGNSAGGDGGAIKGGATVIDSTLAGNSAGGDGGGINGRVTLTGSILDNPGVNVSGPITSGGHNLFSDDPPESDPSGPILAPTDLVDTDPLLGPLADNGGPTRTMALLPGSPAIDTGAAVAGVATDQRGVARPQGSAPDVGAFELDRADHPFVQLVLGAGLRLVGTAQTVTATVFGADLRPLAGVPVSFRVTAGPAGSTDPSDGLTDSGGHVRFTYTGAGGVGSDTVVATAALPGGVTADSPTASVGWGSLTVTTLDDSGPGSLRTAIASANEHAGPDTITFDPSLTGTITLTAALPALSSDIDIEGPGASALTVARSGAAGTPDFRIFDVSAGAEARVSGLTMSGGSDASGGGIWNGGTLTLANCTIRDNFAGDDNGGGGGIYNGGTLTLTNSTIRGNNCGIGHGSAIDNAGTMTVTTSSISGNPGPQGFREAISNASTLTITGSSVSGNSFGVSNDGTLTITNSSVSDNSMDGVSNTGTLTITNSSVSDNSGHGIVNFAGTVTVTDCTLGGNQGGGIINDARLLGVIFQGINLPEIPIFLPGRVSASASIFANTAGGNISNYENSTFTSLGHNLFTDSPEVGLAPTDLVDTDPLLGPLADNGGPTQTQALLPGSPAIDAGVAVPGVTADQRGVVRPQGKAPDIGAFESRGFTLTIAAGDDQGTPAGSAFPAPLVVAVASPFGEPVAGGRVTFDAPTTGASADLASNPATIGPDGRSGVDAVANGQGGTYTVTARAAGAGPAGFALTNLYVAVVPSLNRPTYGQSVFYRAAVATAPGAATPTGTIQFVLDGVDFGRPVPLVNGAAISPSLSTLGAGVHHVAAVYSGDASYTPLASAVEATTVAPAPLLVVANDSARLYGQPTFPLTASYFGFVNGDTPASLKTPAVLTAWANPFSPVGTYTITAAGASSADYAITYRPGTLQVLPTPAGTTRPVLGEAAFVTTLYGEIPGRTPDADGFTFWVRIMARGKRPQPVVLAFWNSAEHQALLMSGHAPTIGLSLALNGARNARRIAYVLGPSVPAGPRG